MFNFFRKKSGFLALVSHDSPGGISSGKDQWTLSFIIAAYENEKKEILVRETIVFKELNHAQLRKYMDKINPYEIIRIEAKEVQEETRTVFHLEDLVETNLVHTPFNAIIAELKKPVLFKSSVFGELILEKKYNYFEGSVSWPEREIKITIEGSDVEMVSDTERFATALWENRIEWNSRVKTFAATQLLDLYNVTWREDEEPPESEKSFSERIKIELISVSNDGSISFWLDDDDLFAGHTIVVFRNAEGELESAEIAG